MKWFPYFFLPALLFWGYWVSDGFSPVWIAKPCVKASDPPLSSEVVQALAQPYRYFSRGKQCFVFESADGNFVLKFFNAPYLYLSGNSSKRKLRRQCFKESYPLAWRLWPEETGILYVHVGAAENPFPHVMCFTYAGQPFELDLTDTAFVLQKKGVSLEKALPQVFAREGTEGINRVIDHWFAWIALRFQEHVADLDSDVIHNFGLSEGRLLHLDPGRIQRGEEDLERATRQFKMWIRDHFPESLPHFEAQQFFILVKLENAKV